MMFQTVKVNTFKLFLPISKFLQVLKKKNILNNNKSGCNSLADL